MKKVFEDVSGGLRIASGIIAIFSGGMVYWTISAFTKEKVINEGTLEDCIMVGAIATFPITVPLFGLSMACEKISEKL